MRTIHYCAAALAALALPVVTSAESLIRFEKQVVETNFYGEGAAFGDINKDGQNDIVYGPFWFEGPAFTTRHAIYEPKVYNIFGYSDNFFVYVQDLNGDGHQDVLILGFPGKEARLYINPGAGVATSGHWAMHLVADVVDNESPEFADLTGDGKREIVCSNGGRFGYYQPDWTDVTKKWAWHPVTDSVGVAKFTHGLGIEDVNGDGKADLMEAKRWWQAPAEASQPWVPHTFNLTGGGGAQMYAYDFDADGRNDILSSLSAHQFGIAWFQNLAADDKTGALQKDQQGASVKNEGAAWKKHTIVGTEPWENDYGVRFSQPHAVALVDINSDGVSDFVTGKRYWAHNGHDPNELDPRVLYWFETRRGVNGQVDFIPHLIDGDTGVGTQLSTGDVNGDGLVDVLVGNKYGCRVLLQKREEVSAERMAQFQPKKMYGPDRVTPEQYARGQSPKDALSKLTLPAGFKADIIAAEPDLVQPIAFCWDERGRLWVIEGNTYPQRAAEGQGKDRILIFSDEDGNGSFESRKVFLEGINLASGIEVGFGGVWLGAAPNLLFIPDKNRDDVPDAEPQILLDGWAYQDTHETLNSFMWGPDGWLYGCHGVFNQSKVGKPGSGNEQREPLNAAIWRYHPTRHTFEIFAHGTSNPWGLDFNSQGEFFTTACVIPHLYHIIPGGRYQRQAGQHYNPYTFDDIKTIAPFRHFAGDIKNNAHWGRDTSLPVPADTDQSGGGHAHCGLAIYNGDNFPTTYRDQLIFGNLHGHRLVSNAVEPLGGGFSAHRNPDFMRANDYWFIPVTQKVGPDGALYVSDWSDKQVCHNRDMEIWDRGNGRIYRIVYDTLKPRKGDLTKLSDEELITTALKHTNDWFVRMARRILLERLEQTGTKQLAGAAQFKQSVESASDPEAIRAILALGSAAAFGMPLETESLLQSARPPIRAWAVRSLMNTDDLGAILPSLTSLAGKEKSPVVRREIASLLQRVPMEKRAGLALPLLARKEDAGDPNIPLLVWYGIEPVVGADPAIGLKLAQASTWEKITSFIYRRMADTDGGRGALLAAIAEMPDAALRDKALGIVVENSRLAGRLTAPPGWTETAAKLSAKDSASVRTSVMELSALFGDPEALKQYRQRLSDPDAPAPERVGALHLLLQVRDGTTAKILQQIVATEVASVLRRKAIQGMASLTDPGNASLLAERFTVFNAEEKADAVSSLASSAPSALTLLRAVDAGGIPRQALSPFLVRQLQALKNAEVDALIAQVWGSANASKTDLPQRVAHWKRVLTPAKVKGADLAQGKMLFTATCGTCHKLLGEGASVGPDLTGSNRANLDYLLENVLDPNALIGKDYQLNLFSMNDGRVMSGIVKSDAGELYRIVMPGGVEFTLNKSEVKSREISKFSTMPEGLFEALGETNVTHLVAYLQSQTAGPEPQSISGALEGESLEVTTVTGGTTRAQNMTAFKNGSWSSGKHLWWTGGKPGDVLSLALPVKEPGRYRLKAALTVAKDYGIVDIMLDGKLITGEGGLNLYSQDVRLLNEQDWGEWTLTAGLHKLEIKIRGADPKAVPSHMFGLDYVHLEVLMAVSDKAQ